VLCFPQLERYSPEADGDDLLLETSGPPPNAILDVEHSFGRQAGFGQVLRRRRFDDLLARPAGEPWQCVIITRYCAGITSSHSEVSSQITCIGVLEHRTVRVGRRDRLVIARQIGQSGSSPASGYCARDDTRRDAALSAVSSRVFVPAG
jgi:hypothetical protein